MLVDVRPFGLTGRQAEGALRSAGVTLNRNVIPYDTNGSWYTSGLRLGTPAVTTLGMGDGRDAGDRLDHRERAAGDGAVEDRRPASPRSPTTTLEEGARAQAEGRARDLLGRFPLYPEIEL